MTYVFQFGIVFDQFHRMVAGAWLTVQLSIGALLLGLAVAATGAFVLTAGPRWLRAPVTAYVELIRNTPLLIQLYVIFFALPGFGLRLDANAAALAALVINFGAYATEILRAGVQAIPAGQIEAGRALNLTTFQIYRLIVLFPAVKTVFPALASQFVLLMLGSSVVSAISASELTAVSNTLQSTTFRAFEVYIVATLMYLAIAVAFRAAFAAIYWAVFVRGRGR
jgi:polar amino acid transport system permease protein